MKNYNLHISLKIFIGGSVSPLFVLEDDLQSDFKVNENWLQTTGASIGSFCDAIFNSLIFEGSTAT